MEKTMEISRVTDRIIYADPERNERGVRLIFDKDKKKCVLEY